MNSAGSNPTTTICITCLGVVGPMNHWFSRAQAKPATRRRMQTGIPPKHLLPRSGQPNGKSVPADPADTNNPADDEAPDCVAGRLKNTPGQSEHKSHKLPPDQHQGTSPAEKSDQRGTTNPRGPQARLCVGSRNTSWGHSERTSKTRNSLVPPSK